MAWVCFVVGALFRWWATLYLGGRKNRELTTDGPYSMCRNPLYFGTFMLTLSIAFYLHSITFAVGMAAATPTYLQITVPWEEKILRRAFGERFDRYRRETTRFWPDFRLLRMPSTLTVKVDGLKAEFYRSLHWMWIPLIAQALADLRMEAWWPLKMNLP